MCFIKPFFNAALFPIVLEKLNLEMARKLPRLTILFSFLHSQPLPSGGGNIHHFFHVINEPDAEGLHRIDWRKMFFTVREKTAYISLENYRLYCF